MKVNAGYPGQRIDLIAGKLGQMPLRIPLPENVIQRIGSVRPVIALEAARKSIPFLHRQE